MTRSWLRPTAEDVSAFGQHRKFPPHARKTSGTQGSKGAFTRALLRKWIHVFFKFVLFYSNTCVKAANVRCFSFPLFFFGAAIKSGVLERVNEPHAIIIHSALWWRPGNEEKPKDLSQLKTDWFKLSVRISSYGCTREEETQEEGTISVYSLKEIYGKQRLFYQCAKEWTF